MKRWLKDHGLSLALFAVMAVALCLQGVANWHEYAQEQAAHQEPFELAGFGWYFLGRWAENVQSEFAQLFAFAVLTKWLIEKGSPQSRDGDDARDEMLLKINGKLDALLRRQGRA